MFLYLESLDLGTLGRKRLKDDEIKKPTKGTKSEIKVSLSQPPQLQLEPRAPTVSKRGGIRKVESEVSLVKQLFYQISTKITK